MHQKTCGQPPQSQNPSPFGKITKSLAAGTYYLRVYGIDSDTNYYLSLPD